MKHHGLFSLKDKSKIIKCRLLQFLFGALRVNIISSYKLLKRQSRLQQATVINVFSLFLQRK